jgi:hypothetical protein
LASRGKGGDRKKKWQKYGTNIYVKNLLLIRAYAKIAYAKKKGAVG